MRALAERFGVDLVGGDTNAWDGPLVITVTAAGRGDRARRGAPLGCAGRATRSSSPARSAAACSGRHLRPEPRIAEALALHRAAPIHAMIDLSDGLSSDLGHILDESGGLGAILDAAAIPIHPDAHEQSRRDGTPPLDHALNDGEDFELCLTVAPEDAERLLAEPPRRRCSYRIGEIVEAPGLCLRSARRTIVADRAAGVRPPSRRN